MNIYLSIYPESIYLSMVSRLRGESQHFTSLNRIHLVAQANIEMQYIKKFVWVYSESIPANGTTEDACPYQTCEYFAVRKLVK